MMCIPAKPSTLCLAVSGEVSFHIPDFIPSIKYSFTTFISAASLSAAQQKHTSLCIAAGFVKRSKQFQGASIKYPALRHLCRFFANVPI